MKASRNVPGWKLLMLVQIAEEGAKRPLGVFICRIRAKSARACPLSSCQPQLAPQGIGSAHYAEYNLGSVCFL